MSLEVISPEVLNAHDLQESITIGGRTRDELLRSLIEQQVFISTEAIYGIVGSEFITSENPYEIGVTMKSLQELNPDFSGENLSIREILELGDTNDLSPLPLEAALNYPLHNGKNLSSEQKVLFMSSEGIYDIYKEKMLLEVGVNENGLWEINTRPEGDLRQSDLVAFGVKPFF